jgi:phosphate butyryltransferase
MLKDFSQIKQKLSAATKVPRLGVIVAQDEHTLEAVSRATAEHLIEPILYGQKKLIAPIWEQCAPGKALPTVIEEADEKRCVDGALQDVRAGQLECIMKGKLETAVLMKAVVNHDTGIRKSNALSMLAAVESPYYHKVFCVTDIGLMMYPDLQQKKAILENAVALFRALGVEQPKAAVLAAVEKVNPKMPEAVDAALLKEMNQRGEIENCVVEGPISYDLCMDPEAASIKEYTSPVAGDPDILIVPNIVAGNILIKSLTCTGGAKTCGAICGAQVPVVISSRSSPANDKYMSIVLAALTGNRNF